MSLIWASRYSTKSSLAWDQNVVGIYQVRNANKTKTIECTLEQVFLYLVNEQHLQFTDLTVFSHIIAGLYFRHCRQLAGRWGGKRSTMSFTWMLWFWTGCWFDVGDKRAAWQFNLSSTSKQAATAFNTTVRHLMLLIFAQDYLMNRFSTILVTKRKQFTETHFGRSVSHQQLRSRTYTFARCNKLYLLNVQQSFSQANENLLWVAGCGI